MVSAEDWFAPGTDVVVVVGRPSVAESSSATEAAAAAVAAGRPDARFLVATRRGNVRGAIDMGMAPGLLPGRVALEEGRDSFTEHWGQVPAARGLDATAILRAAADGDIGCLILLGADLLSDFPDRRLAEQALANAKRVIAVDTFLTESHARASVVLAAAGYAEKPGTTTNLEGRVSLLAQKVTPPGTSRSDWMIAAELAVLLDGDLGVGSAAEIWTEIERVSTAHAGMTLAALRSPEGHDGLLAGNGDGARSPRHGAVRARRPCRRDARARRLLSAAGVVAQAVRPRRCPAAFAEPGRSRR